MTVEQILTAQECVRGSLTDELVFPQIVEKLAALGIERYHADYSRKENTYYLSCGDSVVVSVPHDDIETGVEFSKERVEDAIRQSQRGEHAYCEFVRKTMRAGCVGYFVQIAGRRAIYFGRNGETHVEMFPSQV